MNKKIKKKRLGADSRMWLLRDHWCLNVTCFYNADYGANVKNTYSRWIYYYSFKVFGSEGKNVLRSCWQFDQRPKTKKPPLIQL